MKQLQAMSKYRAYLGNSNLLLQSEERSQVKELFSQVNFRLKTIAMVIILQQLRTYHCLVSFINQSVQDIFLLHFNRTDKDRQ